MESEVDGGWNEEVDRMNVSGAGDTWNQEWIVAGGRI